MAEPHSKLITAAAREHLRPLGLRQMGRSRTWLDDRGWWVGVVEFQPSSWQKASYLNVGAMWLWDDREHHLRYDLGYRVSDAGLATYESDEQFEPLAQGLAVRAAEEIMRLRAMLIDLAAAIIQLSGEATGVQSWPAFDLGIALGLSGQYEYAARCLRSLAVKDDDAAWWVDAVTRAHHLASLAENDPVGFRADRRRAISELREHLKLDPATDGLT